MLAQPLNQYVLQGAVLCCQATQAVVLIWQQGGRRSKASWELFQTILADAACIAGHELSLQHGLLSWADHVWKAAKDTALASSLLLGLQAHQYCSIDQLQAHWAHQ